MTGDHALRAYEAMAPVYDAFTAHHRYDEWTATLERLATDAGLDGRRLLDVACGTGKSFLPFLDRGYEVSACDLSPAMVARAREKAAGRARVDVHDMRSLPRLGAFDLVCCLDDAINYLHDAGELRAALAAMAANLAPGGVLVFDANTLRTYRTFFASLTVVQGEGEVLVWEGMTPTDLPAGGLARARLDVLRSGADGMWSRVRSEHAQRHHDAATVRDALAAAGLPPALVRGMHLDGSLTDDVDEQDNTKAIYLARLTPTARAPASRSPSARQRRPGA
jgi:SAM-dependent methyltransferase